MLFLKHLKVHNYKNLTEIDLDTSAEIVCFTGNNGMGKTNLLDTIYFLSIGKSYFITSDPFNIKHGEDYFNIYGQFEINSQSTEIFCGFANGKKKKLKINNKEYNRLADHVGKIPVVIITPYDHVLISGGSEERRKFLDFVLSQTDHRYLEHLIEYNKALKHRNARLKYMAENNIHDSSLIKIYDSILLSSGIEIFNKRQEFINEFTYLFAELYNYISSNKEKVVLNYDSQINEESFNNLLQKSLNTDIKLQRTYYGIHRDDLDIKISNLPAKKFASQGQQKTVLLSLKLAQIEYFKRHTQITPILLLDDLFDRLDQQRSSKFLQLISGHSKGQIFITDTDASRINRVFNELGKKTQVYQLINGKITSS